MEKTTKQRNTPLWIKRLLKILNKTDMQMHHKTAFQEILKENWPTNLHDNEVFLLKHLKSDELRSLAMLLFSNAFNDYLLDLVSKLFNTPTMIGLATQTFLEASERSNAEFGVVLILGIRLAKWKYVIRHILRERMEVENVDAEYLKCLRDIYTVTKAIQCWEAAVDQRKFVKFHLDTVIQNSATFKMALDEAFTTTGTNMVERRQINYYLQKHCRSDRPIELLAFEKHFKEQQMVDLAATVCLKAAGMFAMSSKDRVKNLDFVKIVAICSLKVADISEEHLLEIGHVLMVNSCPITKPKMEEFTARHFGDCAELCASAAKVFLMILDRLPERYEESNKLKNDIFERMRQAMKLSDMAKNIQNEIHQVLLKNRCPDHPDQIKEFIDAHFSIPQLKEVLSPKEHALEKIQRNSEDQLAKETEKVVESANNNGSTKETNENRKRDSESDLAAKTSKKVKLETASAAATNTTNASNAISPVENNG